MTQRKWTIPSGGAVLLALAAGCAEVETVKAPVEIPSRIYTANESSNDVTVIDAASFAPVGSIDAKNQSTHDLAVSRDGRRIYATNLASGRLSVMDAGTMETIASIYTGQRCHVVALTNDNKQAWVANIGENTISIVDTDNFRILGTIPTGKGPTGLTFSHDGKFAYVSNQGDKTVDIIDTATHQVVKSLPVGANPHFLVVGPKGYVWGTNTGGTDIYVIDPATQEIAGTLEVGAKPQQIAFGFKGMQGPNVYVTVGGTNKVAVVPADPKNLKVIEEIPVGEGPNGIWANPEGTRLFVGHDKGNEVRVIDTGTGQTLSTVPVGRKPIRVVVSR